MLKTDPRTATIPVVMLTRHSLPANTAKGMEVGADHYIPKDTAVVPSLLDALRQLGLVAGSADPTDPL